jgi:hypothetical protein
LIETVEGRGEDGERRGILQSTLEHNEIGHDTEYRYYFVESHRSLVPVQLCRRLVYGNFQVDIYRTHVTGEGIRIKENLAATK